MISLVFWESFFLRAVVLGDEWIVQGCAGVREGKGRDLKLIYYVKMILALHITEQPLSKKCEKLGPVYYNLIY